MTKDEVLGRKSRPSQVSVNEGSKFIGATFLYMFLALAITGVVAAVLGIVFEKLLYTQDAGTFSRAYATTLIVSLFLYIPTMIWCQISAIRNSKAMVPAYVIYAITMGVFVSTFTNFIPFYVIAIAFGATCLAFGLMTLIAWFSRRNVNTFALIGSGLLMGSLLILAINMIIGIWVDVTPIMWGISYIMLIAVILITVVDLRNVKEIAARGGAGSNVALLCGLTLYIDFVYIFIRMLAIVARFAGRR
ncbi:MAG: US12 family protein [Firmicutes bacterium]|nr:US12 family protein [Candidatus Fiminaster equi]